MCSGLCGGWNQTRASRHAPASAMTACSFAKEAFLVTTVASQGWLVL